MVAKSRQGSAWSGRARRTRPRIGAARAASPLAAMASPRMSMPSTSVGSSARRTRHWTSAIRQRRASRWSIASFSCRMRKCGVPSGLSILAPPVRQAYSGSKVLMGRLRGGAVLIPAHGAFRSLSMPINPADGPILGTLYGSDAMRAVFDETAYFQRMLDVEAALARAQARLGIIPADAATSITAAARFENLDPAELAASARNVGYPVVGLVAGLSRAAGAAGAWTHWGATTQDIMDTATVLQARDGLALVRTDLMALAHAFAARANTHRHTVMAGRTHLQQALPTSFGLKCAVWAQP